MMKHQPDTTQMAHSLIDSLPISPMDSYMLLRELLGAVPGRGYPLKRAQACIRYGMERLGHPGQRHTFAEAAELSLESRSNRRARTRQEISSVIGRLVRICPRLGQMPLHDVSTDDCRQFLDQTFTSPRQWRKGRIIMSAVFNYALRRGWCSQNPLILLPCPALQERRIYPLSLYESRQLIRTAARLYDGSCLPACALMLYAGLRPQETRRLTWDKVNLAEGIVNIQPQHSKTGGCRQALIRPVLRALLEPYRPQRSRRTTMICPPNWPEKWRRVRRESGILRNSGWVQDILRHTFASYHFAYFRDRNGLQQEMGHGNQVMLGLCYINLEKITPSTSARFWNEAPLSNPEQQLLNHQ